jgi:hypothetical protein
MTGSVVPASRRYLRTQGTGHASFVALRLSQAVVTTDAVRVPPVATSMVTEGRQGILSQKQRINQTAFRRARSPIHARWRVYVSAIAIVHLIPSLPAV